MIRFRCERDVLVEALESTDLPHVALTVTQDDRLEVIDADSNGTVIVVAVEYPGSSPAIDRVGVRDALQRLGDPRAQITVTPLGRVLVESASREFIPVEALRPEVAMSNAEEAP